MSDFQIFYDLTKATQQKHSPISFSRPEILHTVLQEDEVLKEPQNVRYFKKPTVPLNLNLGYEAYKMRDAHWFQANLNVLEYFLMEKNGCQLLKDKYKQRILTSRNVLSLLLLAPYWASLRTEDTWRIIAVKLKDMIYLVKATEPPYEKTKHSTYHQKFQQYCFVDAPHENPNIDVFIDENKQTHGIYRNSLEEFDILYYGEIGGVKSDQEIKNITDAECLNKCNFVSTRLISNMGLENWRKSRKVMRWWTQTFLARVDEIYVGFKTKDGYIHEELKHVLVEELLQDQVWSPNICKFFLHDFFKKVQSAMENVNDPYKVYELDFSPPFRKISYRVYDAEKDKHPFLTEKFINYMQNECF